MRGSLQTVTRASLLRLTPSSDMCSPFRRSEPEDLGAVTRSGFERSGIPFVFG